MVADIFKRYGFAAVVAGGLVLMLALVAGKMAFDAAFDQGEGLANGKGRAGAAPAAVVTASVAQHTFSDAIQAIGTAQARESIVLTPKVADTIRTLRFDSGDRVRAGQILVEMASVEQGASLAEAEAANLAAQEDLRRTQNLFERGFASQARLDAVRAAADAATARVGASVSRISDRTIRAPFAGIVGLRNASPGQYIRPGEQIGTLDDIAQIKLDFTVPETQLTSLGTGVAIVARTGAYPSRAFTGQITDVDSRVDTATRTVRVRAILPNRDEAIRPGMLMTVEVRSNPRDALAVPEIALVEQGDVSFVYRVVDGAAERVEVETGSRSDGLAEILNGLSEGDVIVSEGVQGVRPGQPVRTQAGEAGALRDGGLRPRG